MVPRKGTTSVVPQIANEIVGFRPCGSPFSLCGVPGVPHPDFEMWESTNPEVQARDNPQQTALAQPS
jgi:hypothetical protein